MALTAQQVVNDTPSQKVEEMRLQLNALLAAFDNLGAMETVQDLQTAVRAGVKEVTINRVLPRPPQFPTP